MTTILIVSHCLIAPYHVIVSGVSVSVVNVISSNQHLQLTLILPCPPLLTPPLSSPLACPSLHPHLSIPHAAYLITSRLLTSMHSIYLCSLDDSASYRRPCIDAVVMVMMLVNIRIPIPAPFMTILIYPHLI